MTDQGPDLDQARAALRSLTGQLEKLVKDGPDAAKRAAGVTGEATSPDGLITARTNARGVLTGLDLDPRIYRRPDTEWLEETIVETVARAAADSQQKAVDAFDGIGERDMIQTMLGGSPQAIEEDLASRMRDWDRR